MSDLTIYLGNKNYASWSLRAWLALKSTAAEFDEVVIPLYQPGSRQTVIQYSPSGRVPALRHRDLTVWDSFAICEYLAEIFPDAGLWPSDPVARAAARSVSAEMHAGFAAMRQEMPMNIRSSFPGRKLSSEAQADINRIMAIWRDCRSRFGEGRGDFLFGNFTIADAMYAPVVTRFRTYKIDLESEAELYCAAIMGTPEMQEWAAAARNEPMIVEEYEF